MFPNTLRQAWIRLTTTRVPTETLWLVLAAILVVAFVVVVIADPVHRR